jgi:hypothetical protein
VNSNRADCEDENGRQKLSGRFKIFLETGLRDDGNFIAFRDATAPVLAAGRCGGIGATDPTGLPKAASAGSPLYGRAKAGSHAASDGIN